MARILVCVDLKNDYISRYYQVIDRHWRKTHHGKLSGEAIGIDSLSKVIDNYRHFPPSRGAV